MAELKNLIGKTLVKIEGAEVGNDLINFETTSGESYSLFHNQDCCESVEINDICGEIDDLLGSPVILAEEVTSEDNAIFPEWSKVDPAKLPYQDSYENSFTWTFYRFQTARGFVTIRWYGSSNGYYSESVSFCQNAGDEKGHYDREND